MVGRRPKPDALKIAQGNPGRRPIVSAVAMPAGDPSPPKTVKPIVTLKARAKKVYDLIGPQLRQINFLRPSDEHAFHRYCETLARYWKVTEELDALGGETYECDTTAGGKMERIRPTFIVQQMLAKRLDALEDRFGLTPSARQQYMMSLARGQMSLPLPQSEQPKKPQSDTATSAAAPPASMQQRPSVIGAARRDVH